MVYLKVVNIEVPVDSSFERKKETGQKGSCVIFPVSFTVGFSGKEECPENDNSCAPLPRKAIRKNKKKAICRIKWAM